MTQNEREEIFNRNIKLVYYCFEKFTKSDLIISNKDEIIQEGLMALWAGTEIINKELGFAESSMLYECIKRRMLTYIDKYLYRKVGGKLNVVSTETKIKETDEMIIGDKIYDLNSAKKSNPFYKDDIISYTEEYLRYHTKMPEAFIHNRMPKIKTVITLLDSGADSKYICNYLHRSKEWYSKTIKQIRKALKFYNYEAVGKAI